MSKKVISLGFPHFQSWGSYPKVEQEALQLDWLNCAREDLQNVLQNSLTDSGSDKSVLPYGQGRSYGDSCLNHRNIILSTANLNRFISFDRNRGVLKCEAGTTLEQILSFGVPRGYFLPVSPGTKYVSVGGAIANDIHGKNHHQAGTFGCHVERFGLLRSSGEILECDANTNNELYRATIGGLGLTGLILWAEIKLKPIETPFIKLDSFKFNSLSDFLELSREHDHKYEYTVAWIDSSSGGSQMGRGIYMCGNHALQAELPATLRQKIVAAQSPRTSALNVPFYAPQFLLNKLSIAAFNSCYFAKQRSPFKQSFVHFDPFFYPLDGVRAWNKLYGAKGFFQFQCVVPYESGQGKAGAIFNVLAKVVKSGKASFLSVLKKFGSITSPGLLSFPREGITLCLDFPNHGPSTLKLLSQLNEFVADCGGALYPAKDATMSAKQFQQFYPDWGELRTRQDPSFSSSFWRRVMGEKSAD